MHRELWKSSGELNLGALSEFFLKRGHPLSQASFSRIFAGKQKVGEDAIEAAHHALGIPLGLLRNEPLSRDMEHVLANSKLSTLILAQKLESLPKDDYYLIAQQIERALDNAEKIRQSVKGGNVTPINRSRPE